MEKQNIHLNGKPIIGIAVRTSYDIEHSEKAKIGRLWERYVREEIASGIPDRKNPGTTYCVYYDYADHDHMGEYTCLIGEEVTDISGISDSLELARIPDQNYAKFTTPAGVFPIVVIEAWHQIWEMNSKDFGGKRAYEADFEVYDSRAQNPANAVLDIYIGIKA